MNLLERIEQRVLFERLVIGLEEPVLVKGIGEISAKVDSGNGGFNVLHGTDLYQEGDMLHFKTVDGRGQVKQVATKVVDRIEVNIGGGHIQDRPVVELDIKFANTLYKKIPFSITDRGDNDNKILICKQFVEDELDALIDVGKKNISKKNVQVQTVNERAGFGGGSGGDSTVGKALHTGADAIRGGMKAVGSGAKTVAKKVGGVGSWLNSVADTAKQMRQGNWNGSFIFSPLGKALDVLGGAVSSDFAQALGVGAAAVSLVGSFPWLLGTAALGYGLWRFSNLKLGDGNLYRVPKSLQKTAEDLKGRYVDLNARVSAALKMEDSLKDKDVNLLRGLATEEEQENLFDFERCLGLVDMRGVHMASKKDVAGLDDRNQKMRSYLETVKSMTKKDVFKSIRDAEEGSSSGANESCGVSCALFDQEDCRLILEACECFLTEKVDDEEVDEHDGADEVEKGGKKSDFSQESVDKVFEQWLDARQKDYEELEKFYEKELFSKRQFALYYVPFVEVVKTKDFEEKLEGGQYDAAIAEDFNGFDADAPEKSFGRACKEMEQDVKGLFGVCVQDAEGNRHAFVCLRSSEWNTELFDEITSYVEKSEKLFGKIFGSRFEKSPFADIRGFVEGNGQNLFEEMFCSRFSKACRTVGFTEQDASAQFEQLFDSYFEFK